MTFPKLKTNAVAQYPAARIQQFRNQTLRFVDGAEQRYRDSASAFHQWRISLQHLDDSELAALRQFFQDCQGRFGTFEFTDPWDGAQYANCSLSIDSLEAVCLGEMSGRTSLTIIENRG